MPYVADLLTTPPGLAKGIEFPANKKLESFFKTESDTPVFHLTDIFAQGDEIDFGGESGDEIEEEKEKNKNEDEKVVIF